MFTSQFMPHLHCYLGNPFLVWGMFFNDLLIGIAYFGISLTLWGLFKKININFSAVLVWFGVFIGACGLTHLLEVWTLWNPDYWIALAVKAITAVASVGTAVYLLKLRGPIVSLAEGIRLSENRRIQLEDLTISLEKKVEERTAALQEREFEIRQLADSMTQLAWIARPDGHIFWYNKRWYEYTGTNLEEMEGWGWEKVHHPDHVQRVVNFVKEAWQKPEPFELTFPLRSASGEYRWFLTRAVPLKDSQGKITQWFGTNTDINDHIVATEKLRESQRILRTITDNTSSSLFMMNEKGHPTFMNPAAERLTGYKLNEIKDKPFHYAVHYKKPDGSPYPIEQCPIDNAQIELKPLQDQEETFVDKHGRLFPVSFSIAPLNDQGRVTGSVLEFRDITQTKKTFDELVLAKDLAEAANRLKSSFLTNMSHEIRTPLNAILGFAELVKDEKTSEAEKSSYLEIITRNGSQLTTIINDILDLSKLESKNISVEVLRVSPRQVIEEVVSLLNVKAVEKGLKIQTTFENIPEIMGTDPTRLRQILLNIVGNAIKFTRFGQVTIESRYEGLANNGELVIRVVDSGIGIKEEHRPRLFKHFAQADESMTRRFGGTGLGLTLSRGLSELLGGSLELVESTPGIGSKFEIRVKDLLEHVKDSSAVNIRTRAYEDADLNGVKVLVAEDSVDNQHLIWKVLSKRKAQVEMANNGAEAVQKALTGDHDLVLMDIQMPVMDGFTATNKLRESGYRRPIIALTAHAMADVKQSCKAVGCTDFLPKPLDPKELIDKLHRYATGKQVESELD